MFAKNNNNKHAPAVISSEKYWHCSRLSNMDKWKVHKLTVLSKALHHPCDFMKEGRLHNMWLYKTRVFFRLRSNTIKCVLCMKNSKNGNWQNILLLWLICYLKKTSWLILNGLFTILFRRLDCVSGVHWKPYFSFILHPFSVLVKMAFWFPGSSLRNSQWPQIG